MPKKQDDLYPLITLAKELGRVRDDARLVVLVASGMIELFVNAIVEARCRNGRAITSDSRGYPLSAKLIILNEIGAIPDREFRLYDWFRKIRNRAAHEPLFEITAADLGQASRMSRAASHCSIQMSEDSSILIPRLA